MNPRATDNNSAHHVLLCAVKRVGVFHQMWSPNPLRSAAPASPLAEDLAVCTTEAERGLLGTYVYLTLGLRGAAEEHILTMAELLVGPLRAHPTATLARASIEATAQLAWLQAPELDTRGRLARLGSVLLDSAHELGKVARAAGTDEPDEDELAKVITQLESAGFTIQSPERRAPFVLDASKPSATDLIAASAGDGRIGELAYRFPSALAHAQAHAVLGQFLGPRSDDFVAGEGIGGMEPGQIGLLTAWVLELYLNAAQRWGIYAGWPDEAVPRLGELLDRRLDGPQPDAPRLVG